MNENKYWDLLNIERGLKSSLYDSLYNIIRILVIKESSSERITDPYQLLNVLKQSRIDIPFFSGDERLFFALYERMYELSNRDLIEYVNILFKNEGRGMGPCIPESLSSLLFNNMNVLYKDVLICDIEKYGPELFDFVTSYNSNFFFTVKDIVVRKTFEILYKGLNVRFINPEIYDYGFTNQKFDFIVCFPMMGGRLLAEKNQNDFISREPSFIATENLLLHLSMNGKLVIILPAKIGFGSGDAETLRNYIQSTYKINEIASLPTRIFYPYMAINTYLLSLSCGETDTVSVKKYELDKQGLIESENRLIFSDELESMNAWNVDMVFSYTDETLLEYQNATIKKAELKEVSEIFRGKAITSKTEDGNVSVVNISNISETGIDYDNLDKINEEERKVARYLLQPGDVLIATKGFAIKVAVFEKDSGLYIASSNLCVVRPNQRLLNGTYLKLFLESETGIKLLKTIQRGTTIVNINYQDICQLEVPTPNLDEQIEIANEYNSGLKLYKETLAAAETAWSAIKKNVQKKLF